MLAETTLVPKSNLLLQIPSSLYDDCGGGSEGLLFRYAKYFQLRQQERGDGAALDMRDVLEMKGNFRKGVMTPSFAADFAKKHPGASRPGAPLRAYRCATTSRPSSRRHLGPDDLNERV